MPGFCVILSVTQWYCVYMTDQIELQVFSIESTVRVSYQ